MSSDIEQAGALISAGLTAAVIDGSSLPARSGEPASACANCGSMLTGRFCQACGQSAHLHRSLLHLLEEGVHNVLHFDAKGWRTLPLLAFRPGVLTRRYIDGQRTRHVSPLALFLFMGFLMFFIVSLTLGHAPTVQMDPAQRKAAQAELANQVLQSKAELARATAALAAARSSGGEVSAAEDAVSEARVAQKVAEASLRVVNAALPEAPGADSGAAGAATEAAVPVKRGMAQLAALIDTGHPPLDATIRRQLENPELFLYRLENTAYKFLFMLIPISLPFLWLMFIGRRGVAVYDHAVFSLYSLSFMSMLIAVCALLGRFGLASAATLLFLFVPPVHMFLQLRGTYQLGVFAALWRTVMLLGVAGTSFVLFLAFIIIVSLR